MEAFFIERVFLLLLVAAMMFSIFDEGIPEDLDTAVDIEYGIVKDLGV
jgi:hypothetical protein